MELFNMFIIMRCAMCLIRLSNWFIYKNNNNNNNLNITWIGSVFEVEAASWRCALFGLDVDGMEVRFGSWWAAHAQRHAGRLVAFLTYFIVRNKADSSEAIARLSIWDYYLSGSCAQPNIATENTLCESWCKYI